MVRKNYKRLCISLSLGMLATGLFLL
uniref:Uncharacterized protein n=1 Tax=Anguilla anguilla TaxID=7936 RepID=A0A0E9TEG7_ANGAN